MTTNDATAIIKEIGKHAIDTGLMPSGDILDASVMAVQALMPWKRTSEQRPTEADASSRSMVLAVKDGDVTVVKWSYCTPKAYPWWTTFPEAPHEA